MSARAATAALAALASAALWPGTGSAHPGHLIPVDISGFAYSPAEVSLLPNETVAWTWRGPDTDHSITAVPGQAEQFDSDPAGPPTAVDHPPGDAYLHTFHTPGRYEYFCRVHSFMRGTVIVQELPGEAPRLRKLRVRPRSACLLRGRGCADPRLIAVASKRSQLRWRIERRDGGHWRTARHPSPLFLHRGRNSRSIPIDGLNPGGYRIVGRLVDGVGRRSAQRKARFSVLAGRFR